MLKFLRGADGNIIQSLCFGRENEERTSQAGDTISSVSSETLFDNFYRNYISEAFARRARIFTYSARLPAGILDTLTLDQTVVIGNDAFRINSLNADINNGKTVLELYSIDNDLVALTFGESEDGLRVLTSINRFVSNIVNGVYVLDFPATFTVVLTDALDPSYMLIKTVAGVETIVETNATGTFDTLDVDIGDIFSIRIVDRGFTLNTSGVTITSIDTSRNILDHDNTIITDHTDDPITDNIR